MQIHSRQSLMRVHGIAPQPTPQVASFAQAPYQFTRGFLRALIRREMTYRAERRQYNHLATLPERLLHDIGLTPEIVRAHRDVHGRGKLRDHWI